MKSMGDEPRYFEDAMSDFIHEMASAGAIRHLVDAGYSIEQIMNELDYPTPRGRVEQTVYRYMTESGMLLAGLPSGKETLRQYCLQHPSIKELSHILQEKIHENGVDSSYVSCPFGAYMQADIGLLRKQLSCLTNREQEYIFGIRWEQDVMYHRLNDRMLEIGKYLAVNSDLEVRFCFLTTEEVVMLQ